MLEDYEYWRITLWINTCLVNLFDTYDQHGQEMVDETSLNMRMKMLKTGIMKTRMGRPTWEIWKVNRDRKFIGWFEEEIFGEVLKESEVQDSSWDDLSISEIERSISHFKLTEKVVS